MTPTEAVPEMVEKTTVSMKDVRAEVWRWVAERMASDDPCVKLIYGVDSWLATLRTTSPDRLSLLGVMAGGEFVEASLHVAFEDLRVHGEWFRPEERLLSYIERHARPLAVTTPIPHGERASRHHARRRGRAASA